MRAPAVPEDSVITLYAADVSKTFRKVNIHKAAGPNGLPGSVLRACAFRLTNFLVMTRDVGFDTKAYFSKNTCLRYI